MCNDKICVVGLGYVGLPLAVEFSKHVSVVGYDINSKRVEELNNNIDITRELDTEELINAGDIKFTNEIKDIKDCNIYIVTVPTPVDQSNIPDLTPLRSASSDVGKMLSRGDIVIYESTVFPGATEECCVPILKAQSGLEFNEDFFVGYSPERINPGDKNNKLTNIKKVVSGSTEETLNKVDKLYLKIIKAGTHRTSSIKVAEASKVIENSQRDLNIAFFNELSIIFDKLNINTKEVIEAASTKWNFIKLQPGLVGGHCISVDPYYLTHKAQSNGYHPDVLLAGRKINDGMGKFIADKLIREIIKRNVSLVDAEVLIKGFTFKENCPDIRNTRIVDIKNSLESMNIKVDIYDPIADHEEVFKEYGIRLLKKGELQFKKWTSVIIAVAHDEFREMSEFSIREYLIDANAPVFDVKSIYPLDRKFVTL
ncbi:nucleotide sugar dehydrogenase [Vibrio cholerae]|uniref:nucleotide sugar dehydrogenase n=1 Tax=Vibrio cholerae TaxID=666 RepID=UPI0011D43DD1|nr:nucleotide sugar dehydrogenase [Vibrio cholerae]EGR2525563.1 nucleotide sugar dehydrogenase [Vibrio cholerae]EHY9847389.1 nucleotide sugar dehydrogenase [Vibrio cholerae]EKF6289093.1 nucleotide sugar dehydrogenase [Vibrio cholerae]MCX9511652.1 nucleotide sugar dehydrogenase [Vibrio cholerae]TXZ68986.1 nucleotide sugar dehydrogenase [Vibrio cholerae]